MVYATIALGPKKHTYMWEYEHDQNRRFFQAVQNQGFFLDAGFLAFLGAEVGGSKGAGCQQVLADF